MTGFDFLGVSDLAGPSERDGDHQWHLNPDSGSFILVDVHEKDAWIEADMDGLEEIQA